MARNLEVASEMALSRELSATEFEDMPVSRPSACTHHSRDRSTMFHLVSTADVPKPP